MSLDKISKADSRRSHDFVNTAIVQIIIPHASQMELESELAFASEVDLVEAGPLSHIKQRRLIYFDETLTAYVVLQTPYREESELKSLLSRLHITLEAHAVNPDAPPQLPAKDGQMQPPPVRPRELLYSRRVDDGQDPFVVLSQDPQDEGIGKSGHLIVTWKMSVFLASPRIRGQSPIIHFSLDATLKPEERSSSTVFEDEYLPSRVPAAPDSLEAFKNDPGLGDAVPRLSTSRLSRVMPTARKMDLVNRPLRPCAPLKIRAIPAVRARVRYSQLKGHHSRPAVIASLDFEVTPMAQCEVRLDTVDLRVVDGSCEDLMGQNSVQLPLICRPKDELTFLYRLTPTYGDDAMTSPADHLRTLEIHIAVTALVSPDCQPKILMRWRANIDLSATLEPCFGRSTPLLQESRRPMSLPSAAPGATDYSGASNDLTGLESIRNGEDLGLLVSISGPEDVCRNQTFTWTVFIVNHSSKLRKLALTVLTHPTSEESQESHLRAASSTRVDNSASIAEAVVDERAIYAMQKTLKAEPARLISLSTEMKIGPLAPSACHTAELCFLALGTGVLHVEAIRVVDLVTKQATDIVDLPTVVCREPH